MINCSKCGKKLSFLRKKLYIYPAQNSKLELADEKVVCKDCHKKSGCESYDKKLFFRQFMKKIPEIEIFSK